MLSNNICIVIATLVILVIIIIIIVIINTNTNCNKSNFQSKLINSSISNLALSPSLQLPKIHKNTQMFFKIQVSVTISPIITLFIGTTYNNLSQVYTGNISGSSTTGGVLYGGGTFSGTFRSPTDIPPSSISQITFTLGNSPINNTNVEGQILFGTNKINFYVVSGSTPSSVLYQV